MVVPNVYEIRIIGNHDYNNTFYFPENQENFVKFLFTFRKVQVKDSAEQLHFAFQAQNLELEHQDVQDEDYYHKQ